MAGAAFFRRPLPPQCVSFSGAEGRAIFTEALGEGNMASFFALVSQLRTQDEPAYCDSYVF